jgi:hypothetical protein
MRITSVHRWESFVSLGARADHHLGVIGGNHVFALGGQGVMVHATIVHHLGALVLGVEGALAFS